MGLSVITREAVLDAVAECDRLGRDRFLEQYGFERARRYLLHYGGAFYDSKAVVGVAHRYVTGRPLSAGEFSGGQQRVGRLLERLGFDVVAEEPSSPRKRLLEVLGTLRVANTAEGTARHQPITLLWALGRAAHRRPRLVPWWDAHPELRGLMRGYGQPSSNATPEFPVLALARTDLWELQGHVGPIPPAHGRPAAWLEEQNPSCGLKTWVYELVASNESARAEAVKLLGSTFFDGNIPEGLLEEVGLRRAGNTTVGPSPLETYLRLCRTVEAAEARGDHDRTTRTAREQPVRSAAAVRAVLIRSAGRCENPTCAGQPDDVTEDGDPILEVDHVQNRAAWGRDHPIQMIALCPNCHAIKTRGRTGGQLTERLLAEAQARHHAWASQAE
ncbi:HNH endonuclease signature motif containing protein [Actinomadura opuntiae]|uniref:HNH endonuclease signature motif containing protein n=1 Tax=Actinomadura sp. OS1-43 TaxID=604315 RepID=UPI00255A8F23|nr:HNH endonuclease signature motif containing protein [Actinomadura sp. OS1-43]MDL4816597.1 HNH endonuclease signature motif containing protein [Actinomadura sp. OS1-43]